MADLLLELQRDVLGDVAEPGALAQPLDEAALVAARAGVLGQAGQQLEQLVGEARDLSVGQSSRTPRSTTRWIARSYDQMFAPR